MNTNDIIRTWTDATFRKSLKAQGIDVPANPAGTSVLSDNELDSAIGGRKVKARNTQGGSKRGLVKCCYRFDGR